MGGYKMNIRLEAIKAIIDTLEDDFSGAYEDLHQKVFNEDYHYIYYEDAREMLNKFDVFTAIERVVDWERDNIGEITTDFTSPVEVANMLWFVIGEEIIGEMSDIMDDDRVWGEYGDPETNEWIIQQMKELFKDELEEV
jgi:hypothetical protein